MGLRSLAICAQSRFEAYLNEFRKRWTIHVCTIAFSQTALTEVISAKFIDVAVLEMSEDEGGAGDVADLAGAGGDVAEGTPATGEQREPAFAQAAQRALDGVAGARVEVEFAAAGRLSDRNQDADACALIAWSARVGRSAAAAR